MIILIEKKRPLREKLESATKQQFNLLQEQIDADPELRRMLTTPMKEIAQYKWLYTYEDAYGFIMELPLLSVLKVFFQEYKKYPLLFSKAGDKFTGFVFYKTEGRSIVAIKTASFYDDTKKANPALAFDLINFVEKSLSYYDKIVWVAESDNKRAIQQYDASLKKKRFIYTKVPDEKNKNRIVYTVTGKAP
jgi:predicted protein tyrosine phosphatase